MKVCEVLIGPIMGNGGIVYNEGEEITLEDATAALFDGWGYVRILRDAQEESPVAGKVAEPVPEPVATTTTTSTTKKSATTAATSEA